MEGSAYLSVLGSGNKEIKAMLRIWSSQFNYSSLCFLTVGFLSLFCL